jgi:hypothetical protein
MTSPCRASRSHSPGTAHSVGLPCKNNQLVADTSTWQHRAITRDTLPCARRDSNPQSQQASCGRPGRWEHLLEHITNTIGLRQDYAFLVRIILSKLVMTYAICFSTTTVLPLLVVKCQWYPLHSPLSIGIPHSVHSSRVYAVECPSSAVEADFSECGNNEHKGATEMKTIR